MNNFATEADDLSIITSVISSPSHFTVTLVRGSSMVSNQPVNGSTMVRHIKSNIVLSRALIVYGPIRSTHTDLQGTVLANLGGSLPYWRVRFLPSWLDLFFFTCLCTLDLNDLQYMDNGYSLF